MSLRTLRVLMLVLVCGLLGGLVTACGSQSGPGAATAATIVLPPPEVPKRTAAESEDMRYMLAEIIAAKACPSMLGKYRNLTKAAKDGRQIITGRLWIERCTATAQGDQVELAASGRAWRWIERDVEKLGANFKVDQYVRLELSFRTTFDIDLAYADEEKLAYMWLTPTEPVRARVTPISSVEVRTPGIWGSALGFATDVLPIASEDERGTKQMAKKSSKQAAKTFAGGYTVIADLCTGKHDAQAGLLAQGKRPERQYPFPEPDASELNHWIELHPGGLDLAGPFSMRPEPLHVTLEIERGGGVQAELVCAKDASALASAFLAGEPLPRVESKASTMVLPGQTQRISADASSCELVLFTRPLNEDEDEAGDAGVAVARAGVHFEKSRPTPLAECTERKAPEEMQVSRAQDAGGSAQARQTSSSTQNAEHARGSKQKAKVGDETLGGRTKASSDTATPKLRSERPRRSEMQRKRAKK